MIHEFEHFQVELDEGRGVLYIHNKNNGGTAIRIGGLKNNLQPTGLLDVMLTDDEIITSEAYLGEKLIKPN